MNAIRIRRRVDDEMLRSLPELRQFVGREVELIVFDDAPPRATPPLETMETFLGAARDGTAPTPEELTELRELAETDARFAAVLELYERGGLSAQAVVELRALG